MKRVVLSFLAATALPVILLAQNVGEKLDAFSDVGYRVEMQGSMAHGQTPLWLNANRYGLSSLDETNGYLRASVERESNHDRRWDVGYGLDVAVPLHFSSNVVVQQAYGELRWLKGALTVGSKEWPMELKDGQLSVWETAAGLTYLALVRVGMMLAGRTKKEAPEERTPSQPAAAKTVALFPRKGSGWKNAA